MKNGFTMIELIFVIVILAILAAVAIPRLASTRDDAQVVRAAHLISQSISDISAHYISQGSFADKIESMTNVKQPIKLNKDVCANFEKSSTDTHQIIIHRYLNTPLCQKAWQMSNFGDNTNLIFSDGFMILENK